MSGHVQDIFHLPKLILLSCVNTIYKFSNSFINIEVLYIKLIKNVYIVFSFEVGIVVITNYIRGHVQDKKSKPFSWASINQKLGISKNHIICILNLQSTLQIYLKWFRPNKRIYMQKKMLTFWEFSKTVLYVTKFTKIFSKSRQTAIWTLDFYCANFRAIGR